MKRSIFIVLLSFSVFAINYELKAQSQEKVNLSEMEKGTLKLQLNVEGMSCQAGCANGIDNMFKQQSGVVKSKTTHATATSVIWYDEKVISEKEIIDMVKERGFKVEVKKSDHSKEDQ